MPNTKHKPSKVRRLKRNRNNLYGTSDRPRLSVSRSNQHIFVQIIDDEKKATVVSAGDYGVTGTKTERAYALGKELATAAKKAGITSVVFDRGSYAYHGRIKAVAEGAREGGLQF